MIYTIFGRPIPLQRHRTFGKVCYDPQKKEKKEFADQFQVVFGDVLRSCEAIKLVVQYVFPIPKSYSREHTLKSILKPLVYKPDLSNLIKFTEDALNEIAWEDDCLIAEIHAQKFYSTTQPRTIFKVEEIASKQFKEMDLL